MAINDAGSLAAANFSGGKPLQLTRASLSGAVVAQEMSLWRGTGYPAQGAIPTTAAICNASTVGAYPLAPRTNGQERGVLKVDANMTVLGHSLFIEDRLAHMGGLNGTLTTAQTVNLDVSGTTDNLPERIGLANYSEVEWYLEWYTATGATVATPTANVTFNDNTTGTAQLWINGATALPASVAASRRYRIVPSNGKHIKSIQSVQLSASTGTAGNIGVTAVRNIARIGCDIANILKPYDWSQIMSNKIFDNSCLTFAMMTNTTTTGVVTGYIKQGVA
jgi:hypothetical protein